MKQQYQYEISTRRRFTQLGRIGGFFVVCLLFMDLGSLAHAQQTSQRGSTISVKSGETLSEVAARANVSEEELAAANGLTIQSRLRRGQRLALPSTNPSAGVNQPTGEITGKRILFSDGGSIDVDDVWKQGDSVWYRLSG